MHLFSSDPCSRFARSGRNGAAAGNGQVERFQFVVQNLHVGFFSQLLCVLRKLLLNFLLDQIFLDVRQRLVELDLFGGYLSVKL